MKAAFYESDITPPLGCYITGYGCDRRGNDVYDRLYSKALVLEQDGQCAVIISVDICEYPPEMPEIVCKRIFEFTGIPADCISISSTHTHYGAPVSDDPSIGCYGDNAYKDVFYRLVADSAILAFKRLRESTLSFGSVCVDGVAFSRCSYLKDGTLKSFAPTEDIDRPLTEPDRELPVVFVEQDGKAVGAIYAFCCHQDTVSIRPTGYSGDYSSAVSDELKKKFGSDFVGIYLPGPSGDINNSNTTDRSQTLDHRQIGKVLADAIVRAKASAVAIDGEFKVVKEPISIAKRKLTQEEFEEMLADFTKRKVGNFRINNLMSYHICDKDDFANLFVQIISVGDFAMFIYPGEMFVAYSHRTKEASPFKHNMVVENSNGYGGYIPVPEAFADFADLYETSLAYDSFLVPEAGEMLFEKMMELASDL